MEVIKKISIDLAMASMPPSVDAMQNDVNTRVIEISLASNGAPWVPPENSMFALSYRKADGTRGFYNELADGISAISAVDNKVSVTLAGQVLTYPGNVSASLVITDAGNGRIAAFPFEINVTADPSAGTTESDDFFNFSGGVSAFYVTATVVSGAEDDYECTADKTMEEITAAYNSNKSVYLRFSPVNANYLLIPLVTCQSGAIGFSLYAGGESAGSLGGGMWEALIEDDESFYVTRKEVGGSSGVYVLSDGESLDNVPESAVLVVDPGDTGGTGGDVEDTIPPGKASYNGVVLPIIPEELKASYTSFIIIISAKESTVLLASPEKWYYAGGKLMVPECTYCTNILEKDGWVFNKTYTDDGRYPFKTLIWSDHNIKDGSATATNIYFEGSVPVSAGGGAEEKPDVLYVRNPSTGQLEPLEVGSANAVLYTEQALTDEQQAQARENIGAAEATPTRTATYNNGDTVTLSDVQSLVLHGKTRAEDSKNLCSLACAEVTGRDGYAFAEFDIEEIPAGTYSISARIESTADTELYSILLVDASGNSVYDGIVTEVNSTDGRAYVHNRTVTRPFSKLRLYPAQGYANSINQTATWSDIQIEANTANTAYAPYYKAGDGIPAEVSFGDVKFSADAELFDGDSLDFANGLLTRSDGTVSTILCNGSINALNGGYKISSKGLVTITTSQTPPYLYYDVQTLTPEQQAQARENIGAADVDSVIGVVRYTAQDLTESQKAQARENIGVTAKTPSSNVLVVDNCQDLSKWTAVLGTMTANTEDYLLGVQSIQFNQRIQITVPSVPLKNKQIRVKFKVNSWGDASTLLLYVTNDNFAHYGFATIAEKQTHPEKNIVKEGEWVELTVPTSAFRETDMSAMTGVSTFRLTTNNANCSINVQQLSVVGEPTGNGIVSFTFDDGHITNFTKAAPILAERGIAATAYIIPDSVDGSANVMTEDQITSLKHDYGWDIEAHFMSKLTDYSAEDLDEMFAGVRKWIQDRGLGEAKHLAYPNGFFNSTVEKVARKYFTTSRTIDIHTLQGINSLRFSNPQRLAAITAVGNSYGGYTVADVKTLIDRVAKVGGWLILVLHIIDDEIATSGEYCTSAALGEIADYAVASGVEIRTVADAVAHRY